VELEGLHLAGLITFSGGFFFFFASRLHKRKNFLISPKASNQADTKVLAF
jgi:hypothetical protein